jgi:hypothetical protein
MRRNAGPGRGVLRVGFVRIADRVVLPTGGIGGVQKLHKQPARLESLLYGNGRSGGDSGLWPPIGHA